jgi:hypothetical protein
MMGKEGQKIIDIAGIEKLKKESRGYEIGVKEQILRIGSV